ncbi:MAG: sensor histidine kinase [Myxococcota bacterium]
MSADSHTSTAALGLRRELGQRMSPVLVTVIGIVALSAPTAYHLVRVGELRDQGRYIAEDLARELGREANARPELWPYDSSKLVKELQAFHLQEDLAELRVYDQQRLRARLPSSDERGSVVWVDVPIRAQGTVVGKVWVAMSLAHARRAAAWLAIPFLLLGFGLAALLFVIPRRAMGSAEQRIGILFQELDRSQGELQALNRDLEAQVANRTAELRAAYEKMQQKDRRLRTLSSQAVSLQESDRRAIGRDLHDAAGQVLTAIRLNLQLLERRTDAPEQVAKLSAATLEQVDQVMEEVRRAVAALGPAVVDELGLYPAIERHCADVASLTGTAVAVELSGSPDLAPALETTCYRLVQEALTNISRHANAQNASVEVHCTETELMVTIQDDGNGFDPEAPGRGHGLRSMQERVELLGGGLLIDSRPGHGTTIRTVLPRSAPPSETESP